MSDTFEKASKFIEVIRGIKQALQMLKPIVARFGVPQDLSSIGELFFAKDISSGSWVRTQGCLTNYCLGPNDLVYRRNVAMSAREHYLIL